MPQQCQHSGCTCSYDASRMVQPNGAYCCSQQCACRLGFRALPLRTSRVQGADVRPQHLARDARVNDARSSGGLQPRHYTTFMAGQRVPIRSPGPQMVQMAQI